MNQDHNFEGIFTTLAKEIQQRYDVDIFHQPLEPKYAGEFNGKYIAVRQDLAPDHALYVLLHLFGHTVQWNTDAELRRVGLYEGSEALDEQLRIHRYEREASEI